MKKNNLSFFTQNLDRFDKPFNEDINAIDTVTSIAKSIRFISKMNQKSIYDATKFACDYLAPHTEKQNRSV